jgi:protein-L-isoaspartate(D-aspartate) O-methyltransferase
LADDRARALTRLFLRLGAVEEERMFDPAQEREDMVRYQLAGRDISDARVLAAMREVPRERFVSSDYLSQAYDDGPLPIGNGQTISQPYIVALMIQAAALQPEDRVLEVGAGSGYAAAVMSRIAREVVAIERHAGLADEAREQLAALGYHNIAVIVGDGTRGCADKAPFDAIIVSAGGPGVPHALQQQLDLAGRLVIPVGDDRSQRLLKVTRTGATHFEEEDLGEVVFVPLIGEEGWREESTG